MDYLQELKEKISNLQDGYDVRGLELGLLENELRDTLKPNILLSQMVQFVLQMLMELNEYEQKGKLTDRMKKSKDRLLKMLDAATGLSSLGDKMQGFKLLNKELTGRVNLLRVENSELKKELAKLTAINNF